MVAGIAAIAMSFALLAGCNPGDDATADTTGSTGTEQAAAEEDGDAAEETEAPEEEETPDPQSLSEGEEQEDGSLKVSFGAASSGYNCNFTGSGYPLISYTDQWAEAFVGSDGFFSSSDYKGIKVTVAEANANVKVKIIGYNGDTAVTGDQDSLYAPFTGTTITKNFADFGDKEITKVKITLQSAEANQDIAITGVSLIKSDDTEESVKLNINWGCVLYYFTGNVSFTGQYGAVVAKATGVKLSDYKGVKIELEDEVAADLLQFTVAYNGYTEDEYGNPVPTGYSGITGKESSMTFDTAKTTVEEIRVQYKGTAATTEAPFNVKIKGIYLTK